MELDGSSGLEVGSNKGTEDLDEVDSSGTIIVSTRSTPVGRVRKVNRIHVSTNDSDGTRGLARDFGDDGELSPGVGERRDGDVRSTSSELWVFKMRQWHECIYSY